MRTCLIVLTSQARRNHEKNKNKNKAELKRFIAEEACTEGSWQFIDRESEAKAIPSSSDKDSGKSKNKEKNSLRASDFEILWEQDESPKYKKLWGEEEIDEAKDMHHDGDDDNDDEQCVEVLRDDIIDNMEQALKDVIQLTSDMSFDVQDTSDGEYDDGVPYNLRDNGTESEFSSSTDPLDPLTIMSK